MDFEWDVRKAIQNAAKHGVPFDYVAQVFLDPHRLDVDDSRFAYTEPRRITLGKIAGRLFAVVYTVRGGVVRLISARKANAREQRRYDETLPT